MILNCRCPLGSRRGLALSLLNAEDMRIENIESVKDNKKTPSINSQYALLFKSAVEAGDLISAIKLAGYILEGQSSPKLSFAIGISLFAIGDAELSYELISDSVDSNQIASSQKAEGYKTLGNILVVRGEYSLARGMYELARSFGAAVDTISVNLGTLAIQEGNMQLARELFSEALEKNILNDRAWVGLALLNANQGDKKLAFANVLKAIDINFENETALHLLCAWSIERQQYSSAIQALKSYMAVHSLDADKSLQLARFLALDNDLFEASLEVQRATILNHYSDSSVELQRSIENLRKHVGI